MRETSKRESGGQSLEIDGENGWDVCFEKVVLSKKKSLASVWSPASEGKGVQEGDVDVHDVVWRDHPACLCVFSRHCELQIGPVFGQDQAVLRRLTLGGRTVPFLQQPVPTFASYELSTGGFRPSHRTTLCSLSVKFRRAPHGPETQRHSWHRTVLQQPGSGPVITSYHK